MSIDPAKPLTDTSREAFAQAYVRPNDAKASAIEAGYAETSAKVTGHKQLKRPEVAARIAHLKQGSSDRVQIQQDDVLREWVHIGMSNITDVMEFGMEPATDDEGNRIMFNGQPVERPFVNVKDSKSLPRHIKAAIAEVTLTDKGTFKVKMHDKGKALDSLARHLGMFAEDNDQKGKAAAGTVAALIAQAQGTALPIATRQERNDDDDD